ncbi:MAG: XTP/dITP diphosphohydrolase [Oceanicoccus sp.]|jgi:XTP/dITP diphosphohydrolase
MSKIVLASGNRGKLHEFQQLFSGRGFEVIAQSDFKVPEADETGLSFVENAIIKARNAAQHTGLAAIADDSGLEVDAINGMPGIYSARYAGNNSDNRQDNDQQNNKKLLAELTGIEEARRTARFQCVLVYMRHHRDPTPKIYQGSWEGRILENACGSNGFGYDPLFFVPEKNCSSADLPAELKNAISHRGKAMQLLLEDWG